MDKDLINKVAEIYREHSALDLSKAIEIIELVTQANKAVVIESVRLLDTGMNNYDIQRSIEEINKALDTEVK